jgi:lysophospholipase L1-like esterase
MNYWFGDSIGTGGWLPNAARDCPAGRLNLRLNAARHSGFSNVSQGGLSIHNPVLGPQALPYIKEVLPCGQADVIVVALGANDIGTHCLASEFSPGSPPEDDPRFIYYLENAALELDSYLETRCDSVVWQTILPVCDGALCTDPLPGGLSRNTVIGAYVPTLTARLTEFNNWLHAMWHPRVVDVTETMRPDSSGAGDPRLYFDGLHPNQWGSVRIADAYPVPLP